MLNLIFVYGTLRSEFKNRMARYLRTNASMITEAYIYGELYEINDYPGAVETNNHESLIRGEIFQLFYPDHTLKILDEYEGEEYERKIVHAISDERTYECWAYLYCKKTDGLEKIESGDYFKYINLK
ncbi:MAG: gamma-glutamylcyclotransferase [Cytophagaceae bacterium]|nr:gamma-glutamylcyclotransferase [Cytophagaceae bacterium]MDW8457297.1 gamma-glutamylcyclotransferase family protein [Cytophagaceae bacterium]